MREGLEVEVGTHSVPQPISNNSSEIATGSKTRCEFPDVSQLSFWNFDFSWGQSLKSLKPVKFVSHASEMVFLEVFAGSGNLSESVRNLGVTVHAIDSEAKRQTGVSIHVLDLTKSSDVDIVLDIALRANVASAHFAPPCGTSSKARERPLPEGMQAVRAEPLRSTSRPLGLEGLQGVDAKRVAAANKLYAVTLCLIVILVIRESAVSVENPRNSYFWQIVTMFANQHPWVRVIWESLVDNVHQACMYGSNFDKWTTIRATDGLYNDVRKECDGSHKHESWRPRLRDQKVHFPTTNQAEYPKELCEEMSRCLAKFLVSKGTILTDTNLTADASLTARHLRHHGRKPLPPLVAEYWLIADETIAEHFQHVKPLNRIPPTIEKGGVVVLDNNNGLLDQQCEILQQQYSTLPGTIFRATCGFDKVEKWYGVLRNPVQMVGATESIFHPLDLQIPLPDILLRAVATVIELGPQRVADLRAKQCSRILERVKALEKSEKELHSKLHPQVSGALKGKNLLIWKELLEETQYPDLQIVSEVMEGIKLVGPASESSAFPYGLTHAQQTVGQLQAQSVWRRRTTIGKCRSSGDNDADQELWSQSIAEVGAGWLEGPIYNEEDITSKLGTDSWICTRRFPLRQPNKIRLIDDGLESGLNSAYSCYNKLQLMDMDSVVALANTILKAFACNGKGRFNIPLSTGEVLEGEVHRSWGSRCTLVGRTLDLTAAYKQLAVSPDQGFVRVLAAYDPCKKVPAFFLINALPFGATSSVYGFNRVAKSLWHIMTTLGAVWSTQYYDDYPNVELSDLAGNSRSFMEFILHALGWKYAMEGKKAEPHGSVFKVLGVELDLSNSCRGSITVSNKRERVDDLVKNLGEILDRGTLSGAEASTLHGQLNFAQGQYFGCSLKPTMVFLQKILRGGWLDDYQAELAVVIVYTVAALRSCPPRVISLTDVQTPVMVFTDGAYEPDGDSHLGSAGLVLVDRVSGTSRVCQVSVPLSLCNHWRRFGARQIILYLELWPILVFLSRCASDFVKRRMIFYIDNNAVRDALIKGSSPVCDLFGMLSLCSYFISRSHLSAWFTRVASLSNPADAPSRGEEGMIANQLEAELVNPLEPSSELVDSLISTSSFIDFMESSTQNFSQVQPG